MTVLAKLALVPALVAAIVALAPLVLAAAAFLPLLDLDPLEAQR